MRFWLDKGVAGFRMDVIPFISKHDGLPDLTPEQLTHPEFVYAIGPRIHEYLQAMHREALAPYDAMTVGEAFGVGFDAAPFFTDARPWRAEHDLPLRHRAHRSRPLAQDQLDAAAAQGHLHADRSRAGEHGWNTSFLCNHDNPRAVSHFGDDEPALGVRRRPRRWRRCC